MKDKKVTVHPFFERFLEGQNRDELADVRAGGQATEPGADMIELNAVGHSDVTLKYPSDGDELDSQ